MDSVIPMREYMDSIDIHYIFINKSSVIDKIVTEPHYFEKCSDKNLLTKEVLMKYIQDKREDKINRMRYKLKDILIYLVDVDGKDLPQFSTQHSERHGSFLRILPILDDVHFAPTLYLFHKFNSIFIVLQEMTLIVPTSILKKPNGTAHDIKKITKKVRISPDVSVYSGTNKTHRARETL